MRFPVTIAPSLARKLGAIVVYLQEGPGAWSPLDAAAVQALLNDPEVVEFVERLRATWMLPARRG